MTKMMIKKDEFVRIVKEVAAEVIGDWKKEVREEVEVVKSAFDDDWKILVKEEIKSALMSDYDVRCEVEAAVARVSEDRALVDGESLVMQDRYGKVNDYDVSEGQLVFNTDRNRIIVKKNGRMYEIILREYDPNREI